MIVLSVAVPWLLGFAVVALALRDDRSTGFLERACLAFPLGTGALTLQMFLLGLARVPLVLPTVLPLVLGETVALAAFLAVRRIPPFPPPSFPLAAELRGGHGRRLRTGAVVLLGAWALVKVSSVFVDTSLRPSFGMDAWANWSATAKVFFHAKGFLLDEAPGYFFGRGVANRMVGYPLHNPLMQAWTAMCLGTFDDVLVKGWVAVDLACGALFLYLSARRETGAPAALALLVVFLGSPLLSFHASEAYSDLPLGVALLFASGAFVRALRGNRAWLPLLGAFAASALFVKDEALFFVVPMLLYAGWSLAREAPPGRRGSALAALLLPLLAVAPWFAFKALYVPSLGVAELSSPVFHPGNALLALERLLSLENFGVVPLAVPLLLLLGRRPDGALAGLASVLAAYFLAFLCAYVFLPVYSRTFQQGTIFYRNILTLFPSLCLLAAHLVPGALPPSWRGVPTGSAPEAEGADGAQPES